MSNLLCTTTKKFDHKVKPAYNKSTLFTINMRPTKLTPELIERAKTYIDTCSDQVITTDKGSLAYVNVKLPSRVALAKYLGINNDTLIEWCKEKMTDDEERNKLIKQFSEIVKDVDDEQHIRLLNNGLGGLYNPKTNSMILSKHGYSEKIETEQNINGTLNINNISQVLDKLDNGQETSGQTVETLPPVQNS